MGMGSCKVRNAIESILSQQLLLGLRRHTFFVHKLSAFKQIHFYVMHMHIICQYHMHISHVDPLHIYYMQTTWAHITKMHRSHRSISITVTGHVHMDGCYACTHGWFICMYTWVVAWHGHGCQACTHGCLLGIYTWMVHMHVHMEGCQACTHGWLLCMYTWTVARHLYIDGCQANAHGWLLCMYTQIIIFNSYKSAIPTKTLLMELYTLIKHKYNGKIQN